MGALEMLYSQSGLHATAFTSFAPRAPWPPPPVRAWSTTTTATTTAVRRCRRRRDGRPYSLILASEGSNGMSDDPTTPDDNAQDADAEEGAEETLSPVAAAAAAAAASGSAEPAPRADEQVAEVGVTGTGGDPAASPAEGAEGDIDWDKAWASTREKMDKEKERKEAPAFSGRKQVVATKNAQGDYDFVEISADGSRRGGGGGFGFADDGQVGTDANREIRDREQEAVNLATTNQAFAVLFAVLAASFIFEVYVFLSGGISNGATRFEGRGQPTTYDALPMPPTPPPIDDLSV